MTEMDKKALAILSAGHLVLDLTQGSLPALLPFFKEALNLSYTMAGIVMFSANFTSSVIQPFFGYLSDRRPWGWILPLSPVVASLGMAVSGFVPNYPLLLTCIIVCGLGVSSFHPEGFKTAYYFTGEKKAMGMSIFSVGGNFGFALGPLWGLALVTSFGLKGTLGFLLPGIIISIILFVSLSWLTTPVYTAFTHTKKQTKSPLSKKEILPVVLLVGIITIRSWIHFGLVTYIPFYYIDYLKGDALYAGKLISTFLLSGVLGTFIGAPLADRWGHKWFISATLLLTFPLLLLFYNSSGPILFVVLAVAGMVIISTFSVTVVMGQILLPHHLGMASGLMTGFAIGMGGVGVTLLGGIADIWGLPVALKSISALPLIGFGLCLFLKYPPERKR